MAKTPTQNASTSKTPAAPSVRGFLNMSAPLPDFGAVVQGEREMSFSGRRWLSFGPGNVVPVVALAAGQASGTAKACLERRAQFLEGTGFPVPERNDQGQLLRPDETNTLGDTPVPGHAGKTANDAWAELCSYGSWNNGAAVLVRYRGKEGNYGIGEVHILPFGAVRKTTSGTYLLNHRFGRKKFDKSATTEHLPFNPDPKQVKKEMVEAMNLAKEKKKPYVQAGQIFYIYTPKAGEEDYPLPPHWAGLDTVLTEAGYGNYDLSEVRRSFVAKGILTILGEVDNSIKDEDGFTELDRQNELLRRYTVEGALEQGEERESILVMAAKTKDAVAIWTPMNTTTDLKWLSEKKEAVGQEVCRHIGMLPILMGFAKPGQLGATQELINAAELTQTSLAPLRKLLLRAFWRLFPTLNGLQPGQLNPVSLPAAVTKPAPAAHA
ncbi:MAG: hypothetical protein ACRYFX_09900 [Janthinobacterium lividum]